MRRFTGAGRAKGLAMVVTAVAAILGLSAATQTWFTLTLADASSTGITVTVAGTTAASALTALSLAALALTAALGIAGRIARILLGALGVLIGASMILTSVQALADPVAASASAVTTRTGVAGGSSVAKLVSHVETTWWPTLAIVGGALALLTALFVLITGHRWPSPSHKYGATRFEPAGPSAAEPEQEAAAEPAAEPEQETEIDVTTRRDRAVDNWDELSRGNDPTD